MAIPATKGKLAQLLKYKGNLKDLCKNENAVAQSSNHPIQTSASSSPTVSQPIITPQPVAEEKYNLKLITEYQRRRDYFNNSPCVTRALTKFIAKRCCPTQSYKFIFGHDQDRSKNNLNSGNITTNNIAQ